MNYEKKFKDAFERAKKVIEYYKEHHRCDEASIEDLESIFPELKEPWEEKIRKEILEYFQQFENEELRGVDISDWIIWLEKQGEHLENYDEAEKEKDGFVGGGFIECQADFLDFKEGNTYWLEYIGDDKYNVRSDNLLGKTYHITPCQLYTVFKKLTWLEKQGKDKEINNFDVLPGLYKCVHRMFDGTPDGKLLFEVGNIYKCLSKHDIAEFEVSYGHSVYLEDPVVCKHFIPFEKQGEQKRIWGKEDEIGLSDALWAIKQARTIAKDENDMGNIWYAERWLKLLKKRMKG